MPFEDVVNQLVVLGVGGFGREVAWLAGAAVPDAEVVFAITDPRYSPPDWRGPDIVLLEDVMAGASFVVAMGDPTDRRVGTAACISLGLLPVTLIHPRIDLEGHNEIGTGSVLCAGVIITTDIKIGEYVHLNLGTTIGHDAVLGDFVTTAPGVHVSGNVRIEDGAYIGTGAVIINGSGNEPLVVGAGAVVAAGSCVTQPVEPGALVAGVPAVRKR
ncbi:acetyltransferase [Knoellia aerolata]|uniref:acetyltransferase n=1 Tax=Knoellia aerolata TaxID=442954 RepID=UPI000A0423ED|nr:acetyltransferase [Knoellia aerolata]